jgi:iron complex outermembrane recepter protein
MTSRVVPTLMLGCSTLLPLCSAEANAQETLALPQITVTAPSPIVRRRPPRPPTDAVSVTPSAPSAPSEVPMQGALPIVTDQFATVTVVPREEIQRSPGSTLGDVLFSKPGVTGSSFAPGASSRPIIRGLDVNRVGIVDNGIGGGGASDLGEDHFVPVNPLATDQIEVIRGPATLRYGSQSIGGVVSSTNNRIPEALPCGPFSPLRPAPGIYKAPPASLDPPGCTSAEARGAVSSFDNGREGGVLLDSGAGNFAFHGDLFGRQTENYRVPSYPYLVAPDPAELPFATQPGGFNGRQPNSGTRSNEFSVGGSYLFFGGFAGIAYTQNNNLYAIPGTDGEGHGTRIAARQDKVTGKGEYRPSASGIDAIRYWWGYTNYKHDEIGFADAADPATDGIRQTFTNQDLEGRAEIQLMPFNLRFAELTTAIGVQGDSQRLTAPSPDNIGSPINGLFDPNKNSRAASYVFNEFKFSDTTKAQIAGRIERVNLNGMTPSVIPDTFTDTSAIGAATPHRLTFTPKSASAGLIQNLPWDLAASATAQYVERAPKPAELFSRGGHDATATFDIGNPNLKTEVAKSVEVGLRRAKGPLRFEATGYYTKFDGFIFRRLTGNTCDGDTSCVAPGDPAGPLGLNQAVYSQRDATFRGGEFQFQWDTLAMWSGFWGVDGQYDIVRATFADGTNVPRIPPQRVGGGVYYRNAEWLGHISLLHAFAQNDVALIGETPTKGYNLLKVEISHTRELKNDPTGIKKITVGVVGNNLLNDDIRNHVSYTKDQVLMPGAGVRAFASVKY